VAADATASTADAMKPRGLLRQRGGAVWLLVGLLLVCGQWCWCCQRCSDIQPADRGPWRQASPLPGKGSPAARSPAFAVGGSGRLRHPSSPWAADRGRPTQVLGSSDRYPLSFGSSSGSGSGSRRLAAPVTTRRAVQWGPLGPAESAAAFRIYYLPFVDPIDLDTAFGTQILEFLGPAAPFILLGIGFFIQGQINQFRREQEGKSSGLLHLPQARQSRTAWQRCRRNSG